MTFYGTDILSFHVLYDLRPSLILCSTLSQMWVKKFLNYTQRPADATRLFRKIFLIFLNYLEILCILSVLILKLFTVYNFYRIF
jgi:hypothetical protein